MPGSAPAHSDSTRSASELLLRAARPRLDTQSCRASAESDTDGAGLALPAEFLPGRMVRARHGRVRHGESDTDGAARSDGTGRPVPRSPGAALVTGKGLAAAAAPARPRPGWFSTRLLRGRPGLQRSKQRLGPLWPPWPPVQRRRRGLAPRRASNRAAARGDAAAQGNRRRSLRPRCR